MSASDAQPGITLNLYSGEPQDRVFPRLKELFPVTEMHPSETAFEFSFGTTMKLPPTYLFEGQPKSLQDFLEETDTSALLVLKNGEVCFEEYYLTGGREIQWISWSVAKSFVSALIGIAIEEGHVGSVDDPITQYVPELNGSAYDGVRIEDVLQMSSGARWNEDYSDPEADVHRFGAVMSGEQSLDTFVSTMEREREPGTLCQYNSGDTQALGMLLSRATGRSVTEYMQEKLFDPLGMVASGYWLCDHVGTEMVLGGLNLTARDFAKIGELYRNGGVWGGEQLVPEAWVRASTNPSKPHLEAGKVIVGGHVLPLGYGYQWWIPPGKCGEFSAIGVYNQFVYVDPSREIVMVKLSANRRYGTSPDESTNRELETIEFLRAVARN